MRHSVIAENLSPVAPSDHQFSMLHHSPSLPARPNPNVAAVAAASLTSELLHASFVAVAQTGGFSSLNERRSSTIASNSCNLNSNNGNRTDSNSSLNNHGRNVTDPNTPMPRGTSCVAEPRMSRSSLATLEYSVHEAPRRMIRELATVFPEKELAGLHVVPTFQKCRHEMVAWDAEIAREKDDRLEDFICWSKALHEELEQLGYWSDMTDPASGYPSYCERGRDVYPDVEGCQMLLKYDWQNAGCCKILMHPIWGSRIYPATFFTTAPRDILLQVVARVEQTHPFSPLAA